MSFGSDASLNNLKLNNPSGYISINSSGSQILENFPHTSIYKKNYKAENVLSVLLDCWISSPLGAWRQQWIFFLIDIFIKMFI